MSDGKVAGAVTADDVARLAGVSRWTVHRAFKKDASISAKSRDKVMSAAQSLGYVPDLLAVSLASARSGLVALLVDDLKNPQQTIMISHLTDKLRSAGWFTLLVFTRDEEDAAQALLQASQHRVDAAILIGGRFNDVSLMDALGAQRVRKILVFGRVSKNPNSVSICCDDLAAMTEITDYVLAKGYQKPLFVSGSETISARLLRKEAFTTQWRDARGVSPEVLMGGSFDPQDGYRRVCAYFDGLSPEDYPDVLICETDAVAMGAMDALRYHVGLRVPQDIAVTGFDDADYAGNHNYDLTTYRQPNVAMAEAAIEVLQGSTDTARFSKMKGALIKRSSA